MEFKSKLVSYLKKLQTYFGHLSPFTSSSKKLSKKDFSREMITTLFVAVVFTTVFRSIVFDPFHVPSGSMMPNLVVGDKIFVSKYYYGYSKFSFPFKIFPIKNRVLSYRQPKRGDVVVFLLSPENKIHYVKRVVGLPGDLVQVKNNVVFINNAPLQQAFKEFMPSDNNFAAFTGHYVETLEDGRHYDIYHSTARTAAGNTGIYKVPAGSYFVMGDNRDNSGDSRFSQVGYIPSENILGRVETIFFSSEISPLLAIFVPWKIKFGRFFNSLVPSNN